MHVFKCYDLLSLWIMDYPIFDCEIKREEKEHTRGRKRERNNAIYQMIIK